MSTAFKVSKKFGIVTDVRAVEDPWGLGITFQIRRKGHPAYKAFCETELPENAFQKVMKKELSREQLKASMTGKKMNTEAALDRAIDKAEIDLQSGHVYLEWNRRRIAHLLDGWTGEDVPFSLDAAIELLALENPLDPAVPYAAKEIDLDEDQIEVETEKAKREHREAKTTRTLKRTLGEAVAAFIEEESDKEDLYLEGLAKNSAASSVGESVSSQN